MIAQAERLDINHIEKLITVPLIGTIVLLFPEQYLIFTFILAGQAHFLLTYIYQYRASRLKLTTTSVSIYMAVLALAFAIGWKWPFPFTIFVTMFFVFHHFYDEMKLAGTPNSIWRTLYFFPIVANLASYTYFPDEISTTGRMLLSVSPFAAFAVLAVRHDFNIVPVYSCILGAVMALMLHTGWLTPIYFWAFIVNSHGMMWYVRMGHKFRLENTQRFYKFVNESLLCNAFTITLGILSMNIGALSGIYYLFFHPLSYWAWALMHLITTLRPQDYLAILPPRGKARI